jgi:hypothetical protein
MRSWISSGIAGLLILMMLACNLPTAQTPESDGAPLSSPLVGSVTLSPTNYIEMPPAIVTDSLDAGEGTPVAAITVTPKATLTGDGVIITSTEDTNCRKGPGVIYEIVGKLLVGQTTEVVARYQNGKFWLIKNPADSTQTCWVWDETTRVTGNTASLPEATPPATPNVTLNLTIYAIISPILYADSCPVTVELIGNYTVNTPIIISYQWYLGDLLVSSGAVTAGSSGTFTSSNQITITSTTSDPIRLKASAGPKTITTSPIGFSITCY